MNGLLRRRGLPRFLLEPRARKARRCDDVKHAVAGKEERVGPGPDGTRWHRGRVYPAGGRVSGHPPFVASASGLGAVA